MRPIDFMLFDGDSSPNTAILDVYVAQQRPIRIDGAGGCTFTILSYYLDQDAGQFVLDIEEEEKS